MYVKFVWQKVKINAGVSDSEFLNWFLARSSDSEKIFMTFLESFE